MIPHIGRLTSVTAMLAVADTLSVDAGSFLAIVVTAAIAGTVSAVIGARGLFIPVVVVELVLGRGRSAPNCSDFAHVNEFTDFFADLGLGMLFFFAGYEIDLDRIRGEPLRLGVLGWLLSLAIAYALGGVLAALGIVVSLVYVGSALATTAIGTLIPVLSDTGELRRFGTFLLAAGAVGEFGPILLLTLVLSTQNPLHNALILVAFVALSVGVAVLAVRSAGRTVPLLEKTLETSSQLAVRWIVVLVFALALLASDLGLDLLLGGFAAGLITRQVLRTREVPVFDSKLTRSRSASSSRSSSWSAACASTWPRCSRAVGHREARDLLRAVPGRAWRTGHAAVSRRAAAARGPHGAGAVHRDPVAARGGDHDRRRGRRTHAQLDGGGAGRRRGALDARRAIARAADAQGRGGATRICRGGAGRE